MADGVNPDFKVQIVDAILFARKAVLSPTVQMAHIKALENGTAKYPLRTVDCKVGIHHTARCQVAHVREPLPRDATETTHIVVCRQQCLQWRLL